MLVKDYIRPSEELPWLTLWEMDIGTDTLRGPGTFSSTS